MQALWQVHVYAHTRTDTNEHKFLKYKREDPKQKIKENISLYALQ